MAASIRMQPWGWPGARMARAPPPLTKTSEWARRGRDVVDVGQAGSSSRPALRPRDRRRGDQDVHRAGRRVHAARTASGRAARRPQSRPPGRAARRDRRAPRSRPGLPRGGLPALGLGRDGRERRVREGLLPLHRPTPRHAGLPRGRTQAEGDQLRPDRRLSGRRDEARSDRAAGRGHACRRRDERLARLRQGGLERAGGARARRQGDRGRDQGQPGGAPARRVGARDPARLARASPLRSRSCRSRSSRTRSRACAACRSISRATSRRPSRSSSARLRLPATR